MKLTVMPLSELAVVSSGGGAPQDSNSFTQVGFPFVRAGSLPKLLDGETEADLERIEPVVAKQHGLSLFPPGTVLFAKSGMSATKGHIYRLRGSAYVVNHLAALCPHDPDDSAFLVRLLQRFPPTVLIKDLAYPSIRLGDIERMKVSAPVKRSDRARIADVLDRAEALRIKRISALSQLDCLAHSIFHDMFGDPAINPKGWPKEPLGEHASKIGSGATPLGGEEAYKAEGVALIRSMNVRDGTFLPDGLAHIDNEQAARLDGVTVEANDVLLNITGASVARVCRAPADVLPARVNQHVAIIRATAAFNPRFLENCLLSPTVKKELLRIAGAGATREAITKADIEQLRLIRPPRKLQDRFAEVLMVVERARDKQKDSLADLKALFASLQQRAFRGEL